MSNVNIQRVRIGSQQTVRVLSNAASPPSQLLNLYDVDRTYVDIDGMILVWDVPTQNFIMTSVMDASSMTLEGITYFTNTTNSSLPSNGSVVISGGVGIAKDLVIGAGLSVTGITTFPLLDVDELKVAGISTLGYDGSDTFIAKDLYVAGNQYVVGFASLSAGLYYDLEDSDGPNGVAYFDNTGKLIGAASTENAVTETFWVLTTNAVGIPTWSSVIDGGVY